MLPPKNCVRLNPRWFFPLPYRRAQEDIHITTCQLSYFVFRSVRALGPYMVAAGQIAAPEDVWCFTETSLNNYLQLPAATGSKEDGLAELNAMVRTRKVTGPQGG